MVSSKSKPPPELPTGELELVLTLFEEYALNLEESLRKLKPYSDLANEVLGELMYLPPLNIANYLVSELGLACKKNSAYFLAQVKESVAGGYDVEWLKACFQKLEPGKDPREKSPEGGDESGKVAHAFLQRMKNYFSDEVAEIFRWNGYELQSPGLR